MGISTSIAVVLLWRDLCHMILKLVEQWVIFQIWCDDSETSHERKQRAMSAWFTGPNTLLLVD